jgi:hypothetical protein
VEEDMSQSSYPSLLLCTLPAYMEHTIIYGKPHFDIVNHLLPIACQVLLMYLCKKAPVPKLQSCGSFHIPFLKNKHQCQDLIKVAMNETKRRSSVWHGEREGEKKTEKNWQSFDAVL